MKMIFSCVMMVSFVEENIEVFFYKYRIYFIEWYENIYFMSGDSHKRNMIIFIPQYENKSVFIEKNLNFLFIIYFLSFLIIYL